jgi:1,2-diacylglycerol 3-alpha-glucosyltransferase
MICLVVRLKLLLGSFTFHPASNGVANSALNQARTFLGLGHSVEVFTAEDNSGISNVEGCPVFRFKITGKDELFSPAKGAVTELLSFFECGSWDLVVLNCWHIWSTHLAINYFSRNKRKEKLVVVSHGFAGNIFLKASLRNVASYFMKRPFAWVTLPRFLKTIDALVALWNQADNDRYYDVKLARKLSIPYSVIPNLCADRYSIKNTPSEFAHLDKNSKKILLCVGNYSELKNEMFVLEAFKRADVRDTTLVFVGQEFNDYYNKLRSASEKMGHIKDVIFFERLSKDDIAWLYSRAFIVLSGSRTECQPLAIVDAISNAVPFISTPVGCVPNLNGGLIASSPDEMANLIKAISDNDEMRAGLIKDAKTQSDCFSRDAFENGYRDLLNSLI